MAGMKNTIEHIMMQAYRATDSARKEAKLQTICTMIAKLGMEDTPAYQAFRELVSEATEEQARQMALLDNMLQHAIGEERR